MRKRKAYNPKRRLCSEEYVQFRQQEILALGRPPPYRGNPEHKRNPGDLGLDPPVSPRLGKTLCDAAHIYSHAEALRLLESAFTRGLFSSQERGGWPQNAWAVTGEGQPLEAQLEGDGIYHGYPMAQADPVRAEILARWQRP